MRPRISLPREIKLGFKKRKPIGIIEFLRGPITWLPWIRSPKSCVERTIYWYIRRGSQCRAQEDRSHWSATNSVHMAASDWCTRSQWRARASTIDAPHRKEVSPRSQCEGSKSFPWMFPNQGRPDTEIQLGPRPIRLRQLAAQDQTCRREDILIPMNISLTYIDLTIYELAKCSSPFQALPLERRGAGGDEGDRFSSLDTLFAISKTFCDRISCFSVAGFQYLIFFFMVPWAFWYLRRRFSSSV